MKSKLSILFFLAPFLGFTQSRDNAGLQGNAGAVSGFFETANPVNYPAGASSWWHLLDVRHSNVENNFAMQFAGSFFDQNLYFRKTVNNPGQPWSKVVMENDGKVGIGTNSPNERLVVNGNIKVMLDAGTFPEKNVMGIVALGYSGITGARNWALRGVYQHAFGVSNNADGGDLDVIKSMDGSIILATKTDGTPLGNVGIGITNPAEKLAVNGNIRAKEIKVETSNWPDYVFDQDYKILGLTALESYIKANKHLPEMPSAKVLEKDGVELGEINKILVKKVEEMTLLMIEMNKMLLSHQNEIKILKAKHHE